jgi:NAD-dependent dihydropyrimidine dehydrogenase PreA subunit
LLDLFGCLKTEVIMLRTVIQIDEDKCTGCGICVDACHEGALALVDGKARLMRDDFCDGMGDCLPACPADAISFIEREAAAYDETAVEAAKAARAAKQAALGVENAAGAGAKIEVRDEHFGGSCLENWPCQIKLAPVQADYYQGVDVLIAADCTAYALADFHDRYMTNKVTLIACPKLDGVDYSEKLTQIFALNDIASVTLTRMEVPCCGGLERAVRAAIQNSGKDIHLRVDTISCHGGFIL